MGTTPTPRNGAERSAPTGREDGMAVLAYILAGIIFYGGVGWVGDHFLNTTWLLPLGLILGLISSLYLIIKRYGSAT